MDGRTERSRTLVLLRSEDSYDWLATYDKVADLLAKYVRKTDRILIVSCCARRTLSHWT